DRLMAVLHELFQLGRADPGHSKLPQQSSPVPILVEEIGSESDGDDRCRRFPESHGKFRHVPDLIAEYIAEHKKAQAPQQRASTVKEEKSPERNSKQAGHAR